MAQIKFSKAEGLEFDFSEGEVMGAVFLIFVIGAFLLMFLSK